MTTHKAQGRANPRPNNQARGLELETLLKWQHAIYSANRRAYVWHNGTQGMMRKGKAILVHSQPDYTGALTTLSGKLCSFDAKLCRTAYYHHDLKRLHQLSQLWQVQESGGVAFLLVSIELERFYCVWPTTKWRDEFPFSLRLDRMTPDQGIEIARSGSHRLPDWLSTIEGIYGSAAVPS